MKKLTAVLLVVVGMLWATSAFAGSYASLGEDGDMVYIGVGGIMLSGDDATGASQDEFLPTVNISGVCDTWAWQAFYAFGDDASAFGGNVDYILASNFDECATCPAEEGMWWFGIGPSVVSYSDLFQDAAGANGVDETEIGANLGLGWVWEDWSLQLYAHYLATNGTLGLQASINYGF
jgi:hypothetical protein